MWVVVMHEQGLLFRLSRVSRVLLLWVEGLYLATK